MKLLINTPLHYVDDTYSSDIDNNKLYFEWIESILKNYAVWFKSEIIDDSYHLYISKQKVNLDEIEMNYLFVEVLGFFNYTIRVSPNGGYGCEFCFEILQELS